jgi:hypothetical protein
MRDKRGAKNSHVTGEHHDIWCIGVNFLDQFAVKRFAAGKLSGFKRVRGDVRFACALKAERIGLVAENCA